MIIENRDRFRFESRIPLDEAQLEQSLNTFLDIYGKAEGNQPFDFGALVNSIYRIDQMDRATQHGPAREEFMLTGKHDAIAYAIDTYITSHDAGGFSEEVLRALRVAYILGHTQPPHRPFLASLRDRFKTSTAASANPKEVQHQQLFDKHFKIVDERRKAEETKREAERLEQERIAARTKDRTDRLSEPAWRPAEPNTGKSQEWIRVQQEARRAWNELLARGTITTRTTPPATFERFQAMMDLIHMEIGKNSISVTERARRCRAISEELFRDIWPTPEFLVKRFFSFNALISYASTPTKVSELSKIGRALFVPRVPNDLQNTDPNLINIKPILNKSQRLLAATYHPDTNDPDNHPDVSEYAYPFMEILYRELFNRKQEWS